MKNKLFPIFLVCVFVISISLLPMKNVVPVSASEEEEFDGFNQMPNYRWYNETATSGVTELLIGDQYETYAYNNETSGTNNLEKSRLLNSRDFHFDSRFGLDIGGNETEYFRDVVGDAMDFVEDTEGLTQSSATLTVDSGLLKVETTNDFDGFLINVDADYATTLTIERLEFRAKASDTTNIYITLLNDGVIVEYYSVSGDATPNADLRLDLLTGWNDYSIDLLSDTAFDTVRILTLGTTDPRENYFDYFKLIGVLDFASHVEGQISDPWDWEDSLEYFYDDYGNVSDFNDGTTEDWVAIAASSDGVTNGMRWIADPIDYKLNRSGLSIDSSVYEWFTFEFMIEEVVEEYNNLTRIRISDNEGNLLIDDNGLTFESDTWYLQSYDLSLDANWTGTETGLELLFTNNAVNPTIIWLNFTYLYDTELGDLEGFAGTTRGHVNPEGYLVTAGTGATSFVNLPNTDVDDEKFDLIKIRVQTYTDITASIRTNPSSIIIVPQFTITGSAEWQDLEFTITEDWPGETFIFFRLTNFDTTELFRLDYFLLEGHYAEDQGFKFSLLNQNKEEGMYFQFTREQNTSEYTLDIDMLDSSGIALTYSEEFNYTISTNGFLRLDVDWHLDKKEVKVKFSYDDLTAIINTRVITDLYPDLGSGQLKLLEEGFPSLCINNSVEALSRSLVTIDYIDADWDITDFKTPVGNHTNELFPSGVIDYRTHWQSDDDEFTGISPYGASVYKSSVNVSKWYYLNIDRFDGVTFNTLITQEGGDVSDVNDFFFELHIVHVNGSLERLFSLSYRNSQAVFAKNVYIRDTEVDDQTPAGGLSISVFRDSQEKMIFQYDDGTNRRSLSVTSNEGDEFTKEVVMFIGYRITTSNGGAADDIVNIELTGFDVTRKDLLAVIVGTVLTPFLDFFVFILTPLIIMLQFLAGIIRDGLQFVVDLLSPIIIAITDALGIVVESILEIGVDIVTAIGAIAADVATEVWAGIGTALDFITDAITDLALAVWTELSSVIGDIIDDALTALFVITEQLATLAFDILEFLLVLAIDLINLAIDLMIQTVFFFWDLLGLPDLIAVYDTVIVGLIQLAVATPELFIWLLDVWFFWASGIFFIGFLILLGFPIVSSKNPGEFINNFIQINSMDGTLGLSILGFKIRVPIGFLFWPVFFLMFLTPLL